MPKDLEMKAERDLITSDAKGALRPYSAPKLKQFGNWVTLTLGGAPNVQTDGTRNTKANLG